MLISIQDVQVNTEIADTPFLCDLVRCKGACCTLESSYGAPLKKEEIGKIDGILNQVRSYLPEISREEIDKNGYYEEKDGELYIRSIDNRECVFVHFQNGIAKCSMEKAFNEGKTDFKKPISCHLFPIRNSNFGGDVLRYEKIEECDPALEKGALESVTIAEFCEESLQRNFGEKWYSEFTKAIGR